MDWRRGPDPPDEADARPAGERHAPARTDRATKARVLRRGRAAFDRPDSRLDRWAALDAEMESALLERLRRRQSRAAADRPDDLGEPGEVPGDEADNDAQDGDANAPLGVLRLETDQAHPPLVDARSRRAPEKTYISRRRDVDLAGETPEATNDVVERRAPLAMSRAQFERCSTELKEMLDEAGITDASAWLIGSSTTLFPRNDGKVLPKDAEHLGEMLRYRKRTDEQVADALAKYERTRHGQEPRSRSKFFNVIHAMGLEPGDYEVHIYSDQLEAGMSAKYGPSPGRGRGQRKSGLGFWKDDHIRETYPTLRRWSERWEAETGHKPSMAGWARNREGTVKEVGWSMARRDVSDEG